jgi:hypothetical protein
VSGDGGDGIMGGGGGWNQIRRQCKIKIFFKKYLFAQGGSQTPHPFFLPNSFLYVHLAAREHRMSFRALAPRLTVLDIPYFADAYSRTVRPID